MGFDEPTDYLYGTAMSEEMHNEIHTLDGKRFIETLHGGRDWSWSTFTDGTTGSTVYTTPNPWSTTTTLHAWPDWKKKLINEEELRKMEEVHTMKIHEDGKFIVSCNDEHDLSQERILTSMSAIKGKMMLDVAPIHIQRFECSMTPQVKANILQACNRLKMYGKKRPIIPRFDEYGYRLPDEITIDTLEGMTVKIVDPKDYGELYFELRAIEFPSVSYRAYSPDDMEPYITSDLTMDDFIDDDPF